MEYLNPLFNNNFSTSSSIANENQTKKLTKPRAFRKDKTHNIKFPVDSVTQMKLRSYCKQLERICRQQGKEPISQTKFNTLLLRYGLKNDSLIGWNGEYHDSKVYMHTNVLETEYIEIGGPYGLAIQKNLSDRKVVYHIIHSVLKWLEGEGRIEMFL
jgi:hypothetical protein